VFFSHILPRVVGFGAPWGGRGVIENVQEVFCEFVLDRSNWFEGGGS